MSKMFLDGKLVGTSQQIVSLTQAEYDTLSNEEKLNGDAYFITDSEGDSTKITNIEYALGDVSKLSSVGDGTIAGILSDIYRRLGNMSFSVNGEGELIADYDSTVPTPVEIPECSVDASDAEKIEYFENLIGDKTIISNNGFTNITDMLLDVYGRIKGLVFEYNEETGDVDVHIEDETN